MVPTDALVNKLRSLGFEFKRQADRVNIYKQRGSTLMAAVRRRDLQDEDAARSILKMAGVPPEEITEFIESVRTSKH